MSKVEIVISAAEHKPASAKESDNARNQSNNVQTPFTHTDPIRHQYKVNSCIGLKSAIDF